MSKINPVKFRQLEELGDDGNLVVYKDNKLGRSTNTLSDIIDATVGDDLEELEGKVNTLSGSVDNLSENKVDKVEGYGLSQNDFTDAEKDKLAATLSASEVDQHISSALASFGGFKLANADSEGKPDVQEPDTKVIYLIKKGTKKDKYEEWIWTKEEGSSENTWVCIGETTVDLKDYALSADVNAELSLKEDKVFVAIYQTTTFQEIKDAYVAGKQIICQFNEGDFIDYATLVTVTTMYGESFVFNCIRNNHSIEITISDDSGSTFYQRQDKYFYSTTETSGKQEIQDALAAKQDTLTAGTDLVINNGVIGVNTDGSANSANMAFVAGSGTSAEGIGAAAFGIRTNAIGIGTFAEGARTSALGMYNHVEGWRSYAVKEASHAEGGATSARGDFSHAEGELTSAVGDQSHTEGYRTSAVGARSHAEGSFTLASGTYSHAEGQSTSAYNFASHAAGSNTVASSDYMTVIGKYNNTDTDKAFVIGNGSAVNSKSDAFIVDWNGVASATKLATSGFQDVETTINNKLDTSAIQFVSTSAEAVTGTQGVIYIVTGTNA